MTDETAMRDLIGLVAAWHRGDGDALKVLRPPEGEDPRDFYVSAFGTIAHFADRVAELLGQRAEEVLVHVRSQAPGTMTATVAEVALAGLAQDADTFNAVGQEAAKDADFIPSIFHVLVWLAEQVTIATGTTADAVLNDYAMTAAVGEAGMFDEDA